MIQQCREDAITKSRAFAGMKSFPRSRGISGLLYCSPPASRNYSYTSDYTMLQSKRFYFKLNGGT